MRPIRIHIALGLAAALTATAGAVQQQRLFIPDSNDDVIMEFDPMTGALVNANALDYATLTGLTSSTPLEVLEGPNGELWVSDQLGDSIYRFTADGTTFLGAVAAPADNCRGFDFRGANALLSNAGTQNGAPGDALIEIDPTGALVSNTAINDPFDVKSFTFNGVSGFLVSDIGNEDIVFVDGADLTSQTVFHDSDGVTGVDFPQQIALRANGNVLVAGFSAPDGIYEYDPMGSEVAFIDTGAIANLGGLRGVAELGNGNLIFTNGSGVHVYDVTAGTVTTQLAGVSSRFVSLVGGGSGTIGSNYCAAVANSTGGAASISASGSVVAANNDLTLTSSGMPAQQFGIFVTSETQGSTPLQSGILCVGGTIIRFQGPGQILQADLSGEFSLPIDTQALPAGIPTPIMPGETWNFTAWFRDVDPMTGNTANFSDGVSITFN